MSLYEDELCFGACLVVPEFSVCTVQECEIAGQISICHCLPFMTNALSHALLQLTLQFHSWTLCEEPSI